MFASSRRSACRNGPAAARSFSSTSVANAAAEVKTLGVIGAGQMVCRESLRKELSEI